MERIHYLAAELFGYSYENYNGKLEIKHVRFTKYMPETVRKLEKALDENWIDSKIAKELEIEIEEVSKWKDAYRSANRIVKNTHAGAFFKSAIRESVLHALDLGLSEEKDIDILIEQICYRTADLGFLLKVEDKKLSDYFDYLIYGDEDS
jgi:hypothetical protein